MCKKGRVRIRHERFEYGGRVLGRHPGRAYTGSRRSLMLYTRCHRETLLVELYDTQVTDTWVQLILNVWSNGLRVFSWYIILNDSAGPKMVIHLYLTFFRFFLKVLERIE